jgi:hypothetical protein
MPVELGLNTELGMLHHEVVGHGLIRPGTLALPVQLRCLGCQRADPVVQQSAQGVLGQLRAHGQGEVDGIGLNPDRLKRLGPQHAKLPPALGRNPVHGARWELTVLLGAEGFNQALRGQAVQRAVKRAWLDVRPHACPVDSRIPAELMAVHRAVFYQGAEDEQASRVHLQSKTRVLKFDYRALTIQPARVRAVPSGQSDLDRDGRQAPRPEDGRPALDWWSVTVEARTEGTGLIDDEAVEKFLDLSEPYSGSVSTGGEPLRWNATVSLEAESAADAVTEAARLLTLLAADAGLPVWPVVRTEAVREDVLDDELPTPLA